MPKTKHTPGPWFMDRNNVHAAQISTTHGCHNQDWIEIWSPNAFNADEDEMEANALLMADSPEMIAILKESLRSFNLTQGGVKYPPDHWSTQAAQLIAKHVA